MPPFVKSVQMILAILLASATAATLQGHRARLAASHCGVFCCPSVSQTEVAASTSRDGRPEVPIFDILPRRFLPLVECDCGAKPSRGARWWPDLNSAGFGAP